MTEYFTILMCDHNRMDIYFKKHVGLPQIPLATIINFDINAAVSKAKTPLLASSAAFKWCARQLLDAFLDLSAQCSFVPMQKIGLRNVVVGVDDATVETSQPPRLMLGHICWGEDMQTNSRVGELWHARSVQLAASFGSILHTLLGIASEHR